jgi:hypothetical protein
MPWRLQPITSRGCWCFGSSRGTRARHVASAASPGGWDRVLAAPGRLGREDSGEGGRGWGEGGGGGGSTPSEPRPSRADPAAGPHAVPPHISVCRHLSACATAAHVAAGDTRATWPNPNPTLTPTLTLTLTQATWLVFDDETVAEIPADRIKVEGRQP